MLCTIKCAVPLLHYPNVNGMFTVLKFLHHASSPVNQTAHPLNYCIRLFQLFSPLHPFILAHFCPPTWGISSVIAIQSASSNQDMLAIATWKGKFV